MSIFGTQIINLPNAAPLTGSEVIPLVQNGITSKSTISAIAASSIVTPSFLVLATSPDLQNERVFSVTGSGLTATDGGAGGSYTIALAGTVKSLQDNASTGIIVKNTTSAVITRSLVAPAAGFTISNSDGISGSPTFALANSLASLQNLSGTGGVYRVGADTLTLRSITGTANQITVTNGDGVSGAPTLSIASNPVLPGTGGVTLPQGTTGQRSGVAGTIRWNTSLSQFEGYDGSSWAALGSGGGGGGAPTNATYVTLTTNPTLTDERVLAVASSLSLTDGGAENNVTIGTQAFTGDIITSADSFAATISNSAVTFAKFQDIATDRLLGRDTASSGVVEEISLGTGLAFSGSQSIAVQNNTTTQKVEVAKNSGAVVGTRKQLNFIEGTNITLTIGDDVGNDQVDITVAASFVPGGSSGQLQYNNSGAFAGASWSIVATSGILLRINAPSATDKPLQIRAATAHSATLTEWTTLGGTVLASITASGGGTFSGGLQVAGSPNGYSGGELILTGTGNTSAISTTYGTAACLLLFNHRGTSSGIYSWRTNNVSKMDLDASGNLTIAGGLTQSGILTLTAGMDITGGPVGYGGGEIRFSSAFFPGNAIYTVYAGAGALYFDHRGTSNTGIWSWRNGTGAANTRMTLNSTGDLSIAGNFTPGDGFNIILGTTTGTKIGTATTQKLAFYNATPVVQQNTTGTTTGYTANTSANILYNESTFTGNTGSAAYTVGDVIRALKTYGLLAA